MSRAPWAARKSKPPRRWPWPWPGSPAGNDAGAGCAPSPGLLNLPPGRWNESQLMDWLCEFIGGGSSLDLTIDEMPDIYRRLGAPQGRTDVIFVTDAQLRIPVSSRDRFLSWKR